MTTLVYLASPYSHADAAVKERRFLEAVRASAALMAAGRLVFSPIAHTHPIAIGHDLPGDYAYWREYDERMISHCDELVVLKLDGWEQSTGVAAEIAIASERGIPITYMEAP